MENFLNSRILEVGIPDSGWMSSGCRWRFFHPPFNCPCQTTQDSVKIWKYFNSRIPASGRMNFGWEYVYSLLPDGNDLEAKNPDPIGAFLSKFRIPSTNSESGEKSEIRQMACWRADWCRLRGRGKLFTTCTDTFLWPAVACRYFSSPLFPSLPLSPPFGAQTCTDKFLCVSVFLLFSPPHPLSLGWFIYFKRIKTGEKCLNFMYFRRSDVLTNTWIWTWIWTCKYFLEIVPDNLDESFGIFWSFDGIFQKNSVVAGLAVISSNVFHCRQIKLIELISLVVLLNVVLMSWWWVLVWLVQVRQNSSRRCFKIERN